LRRLHGSLGEPAAAPSSRLAASGATGSPPCAGHVRYSSGHLAYAKKRPRAGRATDNVPPQWLDMLTALPRPGPWRGLGILSPPAPRGFIVGPGQQLTN